MIGVLMLAILVSVLVIGGLGLVVFVDAAFGGTRKLHDRSWPLLAGQSLQAWAASRGRRTTAGWLAFQPDRSHADELARRIEADAGHLLDVAVFRESPAAVRPRASSVAARGKPFRASRRRKRSPSPRSCENCPSATRKN
jgi:hypothetical protein